MTALTPPPSRRQRALDALKDRGSGEVVTYEELLELIGVETIDQVHSAVSAAKYRLALDYLKAVESVRSVGYRIVPERERVRLARTDQGRAQAALKRGRRTAIYVDVRALDEADRSLLERTAQSLALQLDFARRLDVRQESLDSALKTAPTKAGGARTRAEVQRLLNRLEALGHRPPEPDPQPDFNEDEA